MSRGALTRLMARTAALATALWCLGGSAVAQQTTPAAPPHVPSDRILVMPFDSPSGEGRIYWLREAASVLLADDLRLAGANAIDRAERLRAFERLGVPAHASLSDATVIKIGELVGASTVVVGDVAMVGDALRVQARSIRLDSGRIQAESTEQGPLPELFRVFDRILVKLFPLVSPSPNHGDKDHAPLPAFENFIKGLVAETTPGQIRFLEGALATYPAYDAARLALWQVYTVQGEHAKAASVAMTVLEKSPWYGRARFLAALSQIRLKQYDQAFALLRALNDHRPTAAAVNNLGVVQLRRATALPQTGTPVYFFNKAQELDPADPDLTFNLGYAYALDRDYMAAAFWLREAVRRNPSDGDAHYILGIALAATGAGIEGNREKELARRLSSTYAEWDRRPANDPVPRGLERPKEDLEPASGSSTTFPFEATGQKDQQDLARFHLEAGRRLFQQQNDREAAAELKRAIYLSPYQAEAHLLLGRINLRNGRVREAIGDLKIALWSEESPTAHVALGEAYLQAKDAAAARAEAQRALAIDPTFADAKKLLERIESAR